MTEPNIAPGRNVIAVTGATGFIGAHLLSRLDDRKQATRVLIRDRKNRTISVPGSTEVVRGSLHDPNAILTLLDGARTCVHLAGATTAIEASGFHTANVVGTYNMAACALKAGVAHFIHVSSQAARAPDISDYAASKAVSEAALHAFKAHMRITIIRPPAVIGRGDPMLQPMFDLIRFGWLPAPAEPKDMRRCFAVISVDDLVSQIIDSIDSVGPTGDRLEPCSIASTHWTEIASTASQILKRNVRIIRIWPSLMNGLGICADVLAKMTRRPFSVSQNKVRELLAVDWSYDQPVRDAMDLKEIFTACLGDDRPKSPIRSGK
ncbi:MAG: NAD-dependent epimerase/dehydratase family protein [Pseudomonadota bacterium]